MEIPYDTNEINQCLHTALSNENLGNFSVKILRNSGKGNGYVGDVIFITLSANKTNKFGREYNIVLKCSNKNEIIRKNLPIQETFENEIYLYSKIFPAFTKFQEDKGIARIFDSVAHCYGTYVGGNLEALALENLKTLNYSLYDRKKPLTMDHINLVVTQYGKWHAISAAMQDQKPNEFFQLVAGLKDLYGSFGRSMDIIKFFGTPIDEIYDIVKDDISPEAKEKLKKLKEEIPLITRELIYDRKYFSVITHGDCWNDNFMFNYEDADKTKLAKVAMLDWQMSNFRSPVTDLSYFIYSCVWGESFKAFDDILKTYYDSFYKRVKKLGSNPAKLYPFSQFLYDWRKFAKFGVLMAFLVSKVAISDKDEIADLTETIAGGLQKGSAFLFNAKNKHLLKSRVLDVIEHIVKLDLV